MYLGIDLGTSNSAVVGHWDGNLTVFKTSDGADVLPSVIYLDKRGHRFVGKPAYDRKFAAPQNVADGFKRLMGTKTPVSFADQEWNPIQCSAEIIKTLVSQAVTETGDENVQGTVITIPAAFNQMQSQDTIAAAQQAGLDKVSLLQEPVAAALAAIAHSKEKDGVYLVYDLGGGTLDLALVMSTAGSVNVIAHEGINMLGGRDFDRIVFDTIIRPWLLENFNLPINFQSIDIYNHLSIIGRHAAERAKIQLSSSTTASIFASEDEVRAVDEDGEEIYISIDFLREQLSALVKERVVESIALCQKIIAESGYKNEDISKIIPIGGPSKMPIIREMLESELAIEVEKGLDPMTAVATGAAIFAESREWDGESSKRKVGQKREMTTGDVSLSLDYKSRVSSNTAKVRIKPTSDIPDGHEVEVLDEEGTSTGRIAVNGPLNITVHVRKSGKNNFQVNIFDPHGKIVVEASRSITITRTEASAASVPMTFTLAVKIQHGFVGYEKNILQVLVEKGTSLPANGKQTFRAGKTLIGGEDDFIAVEFYDMAGKLDSPEQNLHIGNFHLSGKNDLERGERINRGDDFVIDWKMSDNGTLNFAVELPTVGRVIDSNNLYRAADGGIDYSGQRGAEVATSMLTGVENDLDELENILDGKADANGSIRDRIEKLNTALSTSVDADVHRSVAEEARKIGQEVALIKISPENEKKVLNEEVINAETSFDEIRDNAHEVDIERHDRLLVTARRAIRDNSHDVARRTLDEMRAILVKTLSEKPEFLVDIFRQLAEDQHLSIDENLHEQQVNLGLEAINSNDIAKLKYVIGQMFSNKISTGADAAEIVELAHLLGK